MRACVLIVSCVAIRGCRSSSRSLLLCISRWTLSPRLRGVVCSSLHARVRYQLSRHPRLLLKRGCAVRGCDAARCVLPIFIGPHTSLVSSTGPNFVDAPYVYVFAAFNMHVLRAYSSFCASALLCSQLSSCGLHVHDSICVCTFLLPLTMGAMALIPVSTRRPGSSRSPPVLRRLTFQSPRCISARGPLGHFRPRWLLMPGHMETPTQSLPSCNATLPQEI